MVASIVQPIFSISANNFAISIAAWEKRAKAYFEQYKEDHNKPCQ